MTISMRALLAAFVIALTAPSSSADSLKAFGAAVEQATAQYRVALRTLETSGREQTAAEVRVFRETWQSLIERFETQRPTEFEGDDFYSITFTEIDARLVAALIVIDIGSREAAREALKPIGETLARLQERAGPQ